MTTLLAVGFGGAIGAMLRVIMGRGFTTFSAFSLEYGLLHEKGLPWVAIAYAAITFTLTISAFFIGLKLVRIVIIHV
jgi:CrcB protein